MPGAPQIAHFAMCGFSRRPGCIEITIKLGGKTLVLLSKRYYVTHKSKGAYTAHTLAKNANVWGTRLTPRHQCDTGGITRRESEDAHPEFVRRTG